MTHPDSIILVCGDCGSRKPATAFARTSSYGRWKPRCAECDDAIQLAEFWSRMDKSAGEDGCWEWTAGTGFWGYGRFYRRGRGTMLAHRYAWELVNGPIPDDLWVLHECDNPPCCNPNHLFLGTPTDNNRDTKEKGRWRSDPKRGSDNPNAKLTEDSVRELRKLRAAGWTYKALAARYGISAPVAIYAAQRKTWKHVE